MIIILEFTSIILNFEFSLIQIYKLKYFNREEYF